jgi:hypothetical protein
MLVAHVDSPKVALEIGGYIPISLGLLLKRDRNSPRKAIVAKNIILHLDRFTVVYS